MAEQNIPEYNIEMATKEPFPVVTYDDYGHAEEGLAWIGAVKPALDVPNDKYFLMATVKNGTAFRPLIGVRGDIALLFEISVTGRGTVNREQLRRTLGDMAILANAWQYPEDAARIFRPLHKGTGYFL